MTLADDLPRMIAKLRDELCENFGRKLDAGAHTSKFPTGRIEIEVRCLDCGLGAIDEAWDKPTPPANVRGL